MDVFLAARSQMAMSQAFHIIFAAVGISMQLLTEKSRLSPLKIGG